MDLWATGFHHSCEERGFDSGDMVHTHGIEGTSVVDVGVAVRCADKILEILLYRIVVDEDVG